MALRKTGRPPLARREIHATDEEWAEIKATARSFGLSISRYLIERPETIGGVAAAHGPELGLAIARLQVGIEGFAALVEATPAAALLLPQLVELEAQVIALAEEAGR
ncbi:hypothetical protein V8J36_10845 [Frigidibacter sp. MR17.14]|uniref:hypothetical protein n=1 Tax=Frigidibacter sp. MR17.14 TaxID=3126509 RepID=UPI003012CB1D